MGLSKFIKKKIEGYKEERKFEHEVQDKTKAKYREGYEKGKTESAYSRGKAVGSGKHTQGVTGHGVAGRLAGFGDGVGKGLKKSDAIMDWSGGGFGMWGDEAPKHTGPPQRVTTVSRSGVVKITEPIEKKQPAPSGFMEDPWSMGSPTNKKKGKHETFWG